MLKKYTFGKNKIFLVFINLWETALDNFYNIFVINEGFINGIALINIWLKTLNIKFRSLYLYNRRISRT